MPQSNQVHMVQLLSPSSRAHEPKLLSLFASTTEVSAPTACALHLEKPWQPAHVSQFKSILPHCPQENTHRCLHIPKNCEVPKIEEEIK